MDEQRDAGHPVGPENDDSGNPTTAAPADAGGTEHGDAAEHHDSGEHGDAAAGGSSRQQEMLRQVQEMIDNLAREARPVMRELAAKSAELAALAAQRAGPLAAKAAEKTQAYGDRFAARSKEVAADLRRQEGAGVEPGSTSEPARDERIDEPDEADRGG